MLDRLRRHVTYANVTATVAHQTGHGWTGERDARRRRDRGELVPRGHPRRRRCRLDAHRVGGLWRREEGREAPQVARLTRPGPAAHLGDPPPRHDGGWLVRLA